MPSLASAGEPVGPFGQPGHWFKGNLHVHSTNSDGNRTPGEVIDWYRKHGYHFLALTDHRTWWPAGVLSDGFVVLSGIEVDGTDPRAGLFHLVGIGPTTEPRPAWEQGTSMQHAADRLREAGAQVMLAHPYWSGQMSRDLLGLQGCFGLEVYNGGCELDDAKGFSLVHWDDLLAAGCRLWGVAADDAHWRRGAVDAGLGWVWVRATALTREAILRALEQGSFYASSGPEILGLTWERAERRLTVRCQPVVAVDFIGSGWRSRRVSAPPGQELTEASHQLSADQTYVRVACQNRQGRWAWSNPLFLDMLQAEGGV